MKRFSEHSLFLQYPFSGQAGKLLIDVGGHEGGVTTSFAKRGWKVIAFEPEENNRKTFEKNTKKYGGQVTCIPKVVTDHSGDKIPFYVSPKHFGIHSIQPFHDTHQLAYEVETVRLKDVLNELNVPYVTFLKVDTEGADFLALKGFDWDKYKPEVIMVEFMDERSIKNFDYTHHDMASFMQERGYVCFVSEWSPIKEYGIKGVLGEPHTWIQCEKYPLDHEPAWGNLIFVPIKKKKVFLKTYKRYLSTLRDEQSSVLRTFAKKIPGVKWFYNSFLR